MTLYTTVESPIGATLLVGDVVAGHIALTGTYLGGQRYERAIGADWERDDVALGDAREQLMAYFAGTSTSFELPISFDGSDFQRKVWQALLDIPYGTTCTYGELAARVADRSKTRAVAAAVGRNPVGVIVPCHRVIGADGSLTGYAGGLDRKRWLLDHEARVAGLTLAL